MNKLLDIRFIDKAVKNDILKKNNKEFVYALNKKINGKIYQYKNKYFVDYFNLEDDTEIKLIDFEKIIESDSSGLSIKDKIENFDYQKFIEIEDLILNILYPAIKKEINGFSYELFLNDIYTTDLPFQRDVLIVKNNNKIIARAYVTGLLFNQQEIKELSEEMIDKIIQNNADLKMINRKMLLSSKNEKQEMINNYISTYTENKFIDSVYVLKDFRCNGIGEEIYKFLFSYYNEQHIKLTSGNIEIQTESAKMLWKKLKRKYPDNVIVNGNALILKF